MPASTRARPDALLDMPTAAALVGYSVEYIRKLRPGVNTWCTAPVPFIKVGGRTMIRRRDLAVWAATHGIPLRDEIAS